MEISFLTIKKEDKDFEKHVKSANKIWSKVFGNEYEEDECPGDILVIGSFDEKPVCTVSNGSTVSNDSSYNPERVVCTAIIEISTSGKKALISCMGAYPQKCGYGSSLIQYIIKFLKNLGVTKIYIKIDKDDKAKRLEKFYSNYGFTKIKEYKEYKECEEDVLFYYDSKFEYIMFCKLDSDSDLDITNLKIDI
jgi:N-acetylglutamate synthase-like GNAT family acetyltransferase